MAGVLKFPQLVGNQWIEWIEWIEQEGTGGNRGNGDEQKQTKETKLGHGVAPGRFVTGQ
jgi:poly(3-hydroxyalkanoate) synthetase